MNKLLIQRGIFNPWVLSAPSTHHFSEVVFCQRFMEFNRVLKSVITRKSDVTLCHCAFNAQLIRVFESFQHTNKTLMAYNQITKCKM